MQTDIGTLYCAIASFIAILAAGCDIRSRRIPNALVGPALALGLSLHLAMDGWRGLLSSFAAVCIAGGIFLIFFIAGGMGGGDVKLIAALASIVGLGYTGYLLVFTALAGGVMGVGLALLHGQLRQTFFNMSALASHHRHQGLSPHPDLNIKNIHTLRLPYGVAIAIGSLLTLYLHTTQGGL